MKKNVFVIGGGLAGSEAAYQLARRGVPVCLFEMRDSRMTAAHKSATLGELVCSNSLGSDKPFTAPGMLKAELRELGSLIMEAAAATAVPAGGALAVDREQFARYIESKIEAEPLITVRREEVTAIPESPQIVIVASGPLTSDALAEDLKRITGSSYFYFYDAISPIIDAASIDYSKAFWGGRYEEGHGDYLNCPMTEAEYDLFYDTLMSAERVEIEEFERYFEGCMPVEAMADRGKKTLLFGPMKPVGLKDKDGRQPFCVCQLRREDILDSSFNMVGFQTRLKRHEQKKVFGLIPALKEAVYLRYGSVHRNTFINAPALLDDRLRLKAVSGDIFIAGQISGVEGYIESTAMGMIAGMNAAAAFNGHPLPSPPPRKTAIGALIHYITNAPSKNFQPMNINFGIIEPPEQKEKNKEKQRMIIAGQSMQEIKDWKNRYESL